MATKSERQNRKAIIIEQIFDRRWDSGTQSLKRDLVTLRDVSDAIKRFNRKVPKGLKPLSDKNPANFFKDFIPYSRVVTQPAKKLERETPSDLSGYHPGTSRPSS